MRGTSILFRCGKWILGGSVGLASTGFVVSHCATPTRSAKTSVSISPPDFAPTTSWDFNWDRRDPRFLKHQAWTKDETKKNVNSKINNNDGGDCNEGTQVIPKVSNEEGNKTLEWPKAKRNVILVRHGQYNQAGDDDDGHTLTKLGEEQAVLAGKRLKASGIKFNSIVASGMTRAIQTANIIAKEIGQEGLKVEVKDSILNEGPPCIPEPPYRNAQLWDPDFNEFFEHGARIEAAFRKYIHRADLCQEKDSQEIIVCHGNVIRYFTMRAMQFPPEGWLRIAIDHTSLTKISVFPEGDVVLRCLGDSGHLPAEKATA